jgi:hypothetical protein
MRTMSTKSKRRSARRHESQGPTSTARPTPETKVAGEIVGALINAITLGALEGPASGKQRAPTEPKSATP